MLNSTVFNLLVFYFLKAEQISFSAELSMEKSSETSGYGYWSGGSSRPFKKGTTNHIQITLAQKANRAATHGTNRLKIRVVAVAGKPFLMLQSNREAAHY